MKIKELEFILEKSWCKETCVPSMQDNWSSNNPTLGQCAITSLIVNDFCGGKIMRCMTSTGSHYYNLINNELIDLTREQFGEEVPGYKEGQERTREYLLSNEDTKNRYLILLSNVKENFNLYGNYYYKLINEDGNKYFSKIPGTIGGNSRLKIYGKLDCKSALRWIHKGYYIDNRVFFEDEDVAIRAGYRPCGICMKDKYNLWKEKNIIKVKKR